MGRSETPSPRSSAESSEISGDPVLKHLHRAGAICFIDNHESDSDACYSDSETGSEADGSEDSSHEGDHAMWPWEDSSEEGDHAVWPWGPEVDDPVVTECSSSEETVGDRILNWARTVSSSWF